jgi:hypothetical protein
MRWLVLAANLPPKPQWGDILIPALWLVAGLVLAAGVLVAVRKWTRPAAASPDEDLHRQMARFRAAFQQGQMSKTEYDRVYALLAEKIRQQTGMAPRHESAENQPSRPPRERAEFEPDDDEPGAETVTKPAN